MKRQPFLSRTLLIMLGTMIFANIASMMYETFLPLYLQRLGANVGNIGLFYTLSALAPLVLQILGGWFSDVMGRLRAMAIGSVGGLVAFILLVVAPTWQWLLLSSVTVAVAYAFVGPSFRALIAEESSEQSRGRVFGLVDSLYMIVGVIGPPLGGFLIDHFSYRIMFIVAAVLYGMATLGRILVARHAHKNEVKTGQTISFQHLKRNLGTMAGFVLAGGIVTWIMVSDGAQDIAYSLRFQLEPLYLQNLMGLTNTQIGGLSSISSIVLMLLMVPAGWLSDKRGERVGIALGTLLVAGALGVFLISRNLMGFTVAWVLFGIGRALVGPPYNSLISKVIPARIRGTAFGLFSTSIGFFSLPAPFIGAKLWEWIAPQAPFAVSLLLILATVPIVWTQFRPAAIKPLELPDTAES
jgi:MFS family permease